jgi:hypothetical protein
MISDEIYLLDTVILTRIRFRSAFGAVSETRKL